MGLSALVFASMLAGCCMFWKRAYDDSMPDHVDRCVFFCFFRSLPPHIPPDYFRGVGRTNIPFQSIVGRQRAPSYLVLRCTRLGPHFLQSQRLSYSSTLASLLTTVQITHRNYTSEEFSAFIIKHCSHVPWDPFKDNGLLGENKRTRGRRARREGDAAAKLDPLGVLIMGKMPGLNEGKIMPM